MRVEISLEQRVQALYDIGIKKAKTVYNKLRNHVNVSLSTIYRIIDKISDKKNLPDKTKKIQKNKKIFEKDEKRIKKLLKNNPLLTAKEISEALKLRVSKQAIAQRLKKMGYYNKKVIKKPLLSKKNLFDRINFAQNNLNEDGKNVIFVDEASFGTHSHYDKCGIESNAEPVIIQTPKYGEKLNIFGGISGEGKTSLHIWDFNMDSAYYKEILKKNLLPDAKKLYGAGNFKILQDKSPMHTAKNTKDFLNKMEIEGYEDWPGNSPDLNVIENIWCIMKNRVAKSQPKTKKELKKAIKQAWKSISIEDCRNLISNMKKRLLEVISRRGYNTHY